VATARLQRRGGGAFRQEGGRSIDDCDAARLYLDSLSPLVDMLGAFVLLGGAAAR
jgi:hypothetical protein